MLMLHLGLLAHMELYVPVQYLEPMALVTIQVLIKMKSNLKFSPDRTSHVPCSPLWLYRLHDDFLQSLLVHPHKE